MSQIPFVCSNCGGNKFRVSSEPKDLDEMIGAPCADCGTPLTEDAVKKQALKIAEDALKKALGDSGLHFKT
jgi:predicted  nucleic acid-binding Zn-ribbon protein